MKKKVLFLISILFIGLLTMSIISCNKKNEYHNYIIESLTANHFFQKTEGISSLETINSSINEPIKHWSEKTGNKNFTVKLQSFKIYENKKDSSIISAENLFIYEFENSRQAKNYYNYLLDPVTPENELYLFLDGNYMYMTSLEDIVTLLNKIEFTYKPKP